MMIKIWRKQEQVKTKPTAIVALEISGVGLKWKLKELFTHKETPVLYLSGHHLMSVS